MGCIRIGEVRVFILLFQSVSQNKDQPLDRDSLTPSFNKLLQLFPWPHRLEAWDTSLSRRRQGFESPWGYKLIF